MGTFERRWIWISQKNINLDILDNVTTCLTTGGSRNFHKRGHSSHASVIPYIRNQIFSHKRAPLPESASAYTKMSLKKNGYYNVCVYHTFQ